jgi:hypothetical protein
MRVRGTGVGTVWAALCGAVLALGVGCRKDVDAAQPLPPKVEKAVALSAPSPAPAPVYPEETYGDLEFAKSPRIQFLWSPQEPVGSENLTIWSMKLDGSDIRRAVAPEVLFGGAVKELHDATRSPNGRYIACTGGDRDSDEVRCLVDLKERSIQVISKANGQAYFNWTPDSRQIIFYGSGELWQYDVELKKLTHLPLIYSAGLTLVDGGRRLVALNDYKIEYYDRTGRLLQKLKQPFEAGRYHTVSADGRTFLLRVGAESVFFRSDHPDKVLWRDGKFRPRAVFGPDGDVVYFTEGSKFTELNLKTGQEKVVVRLPGEVPNALTLINLRSGS